MKRRIIGRQSRRGQAMIIAILTLGGAILGATALAGFLMLYEIRSTTDSANSAKAIFAADAGVNWALYSYFNPAATEQGGAQQTLGNGAAFAVACADDTGAAVACNNASSVSAISEGASNGSRRAFFVSITGATSTLP